LVRPTPADMLSALVAAVADVAAPKPPQERNSKSGGGHR